MVDSEPSPEPKAPTVAEAANQCLESFQQCLFSASSVHPREISMVEDQLARFSSWASGIQVFAPGSASMDHRLRYAPEVQSVVAGLVESLNYRVQTCRFSQESRLAPPSSRVSQPTIAGSKALAKAAEPSTTDVSAAANERLGQSFLDIAAEITSLNKISNTIRRASKDTQALKASNFQIKDDEGKDVEPLLLKHFERHIGDCFPGVSENIQQRLARGMLLRRKKILYRRHRQGSTIISAETSVSQTAVTLPDAQADVGSSVPDKVKTVGKKSVIGKTVPRVAPSQVRSATTLAPEKYKMVSSSPSIISASRTIASGKHQALKYPPAPGYAAKRRYEQLKSQREAEGDGTSTKDLLEADLRAIGEIVCPYCLYALPAAEVFDERKWQKHVRNDLDPYVCLFEECNQPDVLYTHSDDWLGHLHQHGKIWRCSSHREMGPFSTLEEYMKHMREVHETKLSDKQLRVVANRNSRKAAKLFPSCPLCGREESEVEGRLEDHIAGHLRSLALKSLPSYQDETPDDDGDGNNSIDGSRPRSRSTIKEMEEDHEDIFGDWETPSLQPVDPEVMEFATVNFMGHADFHLDPQDNLIEERYASLFIDTLAMRASSQNQEDDPILRSLLQGQQGQQDTKEIVGMLSRFVVRDLHGFGGSYIGMQEFFYLRGIFNGTFFLEKLHTCLQDKPEIREKLKQALTLPIIAPVDEVYAQIIAVLKFAPDALEAFERLQAPPSPSPKQGYISDDYVPDPYRFIVKTKAMRQKLNPVANDDFSSREDDNSAQENSANNEEDEGTESAGQTTRPPDAPLTDLIDPPEQKEDALSPRKERSSGVDVDGKKTMDLNREDRSPKRRPSLNEDVSHEEEAGGTGSGGEATELPDIPPLPFTRSPPSPTIGKEDPAAPMQKQSVDVYDYGMEMLDSNREDGPSPERQSPPSSSKDVSNASTSSHEPPKPDIAVDSRGPTSVPMGDTMWSGSWTGTSPNPPLRESPALFNLDEAFEADVEDDAPRRRSTRRKDRSPYVYVNGQKVLIPVRERTPPGPRSNPGRVVIVDGPQTPRTAPPGLFMDYTASSRPDNPARRRPVIIDERPYTISVEDGRTRHPRHSSDGPRSTRSMIEIEERTHPRHHSEASRSARSMVDETAAEIRRRRRQERRAARNAAANAEAMEEQIRKLRGEAGTAPPDDEMEAKERRERRLQARIAEANAKIAEREMRTLSEANADIEEEERREQRLKARIARANAEINARPPVPIPPPPVRRRPVADPKDPKDPKDPEDPADRDAELREAVRRMDMEQPLGRARRLEMEEARKEEEAQRRRLMERMEPRRRRSLDDGGVNRYDYR